MKNIYIASLIVLPPRRDAAVSLPLPLSHTPHGHPAINTKPLTCPRTPPLPTTWPTGSSRKSQRPTARRRKGWKPMRPTSPGQTGLTTGRTPTPTAGWIPTSSISCVRWTQGGAEKGAERELDRRDAKARELPRAR